MKFSFGDTLDMTIAVVTAYNTVPEHSVERINAYSNTITALKYQENYSKDEILSIIRLFIKLIFDDVSSETYVRLATAYENIQYSEVKCDE